MTKPESEISNKHAGIKYDITVWCIWNIFEVVYSKVENFFDHVDNLYIFHKSR